MPQNVELPVHCAEADGHTAPIHRRAGVIKENPFCHEHKEQQRLMP
jgi:hypothetical protein